MVKSPGCRKGNKLCYCWWQGANVGVLWLSQSRINSKSLRVPLYVGFIILLVKSVPKSIMDLAGSVFIDVLFIIENRTRISFEHHQ